MHHKEFKTIRSTFKKDDVIFLLKDLTDSGMKALGTEDREKMIQSGVHYSEMLPLEYVPTNDYLEIYEKSLREQSYETASALGTMIEAVLIFKKMREINEGLTPSNRIAIVSLARAGTPIGVLFKRYMEMKHPEYSVEHYSISIIRGKGIDRNAMEYISEHENVSDIVFLDGWTGKGAIDTVLKQEVAVLKGENPEKWEKLSDELVVLADPANICKVCGTHEDLLVPSSCLNSTVTGLVSRTILNDKYIDVDAGEFHGAVYFGNNPGMIEADKTYEFIDTIVDFFNAYDKCVIDILRNKAKEVLALGIDGKTKGVEIVKDIANREGIDDYNKIKPGIGECTRVLLRRVPKKVLVNEAYLGEKSLEHIFQLCNERNVPVESSSKIGKYKVVGVIADLNDV